MEKESNMDQSTRRRRLIRRMTLGLGLAVAMAPTPTAARERAASPRRADRATPPWFEPGDRTPPPRSSGSTEVPVLGSHPAVHGERLGPVTPLFPRASRADRRGGTGRAEAMAKHPAGKGRTDVRVEVRPGDSLWSITEERVGTGRTAECWPRLYRANRTTIGPDPAHIVPGQSLTVPRECR